MLDMVYDAFWFTWSITATMSFVFAPFWVLVFIRDYRRWRNAKDDDDENTSREFRAAGSRVKKQLVQRMREMKPGPIRLPMPQPA